MPLAADSISALRSSERTTPDWDCAEKMWNGVERQKKLRPSGCRGEAGGVLCGLQEGMCHESSMNFSDEPQC
ncbi:hypothetical protein AAY473_013741 [Plecturocebus cupreus]